MIEKSAEEIVQFIKSGFHRCNPFVKLCGIEYEQIQCGSVTLGMDTALGKHANTYGELHGGALATLADTAMGCTAVSVGMRVVTMSLTMSFIKNIKMGERVTSTGKILHHGRRTMVLEAGVFDGKGELMAKGQGTFFVIDTIREIPREW